MPTRILIKNIANTWLTGDVIDVCDDSHMFGRLESKERFIDSGESPDDWPRQFVIVNVTDAAPSDYFYLTENNEQGRRYYIQPQGEDSPFYDQLLENAEVTVTKKILDALIMDRGV